MNFKIPRHQYSVVILDSRQDRAEPTLMLLKSAGYEPRFFQEHEALRAALDGQPPHMVIVHRSDETNPIARVLAELRDRLPESHFVVLSSAAGLSATWREWGEQIYDCILTPPVHPQQLIQAVDRAAERDAFMYKAEELAEKIAQAEAKIGQAIAAAPPPTDDVAPLVIPPATSDLRYSLAELQEETQQFVAAVMSEVEDTAGIDVVRGEQEDLQTADTLVSNFSLQEMSSGYDFWSIWTRLAQQTRIEDVVRETVMAVAEMSQGAPTVFLKYLPNRRTLVTSAGQGLPAEAWKSLGLDLSQEPDFRIGDLKFPEKLPGLKEMAQAVASSDGVWARPISLQEDVHGLVVVFKEPAHLQTNELEAVLRLAESRAQMIDLHQYIHTIEVLDPATHLLNRASFQSRLAGEVARARRLMLPVSVLIISLDQHREIIAQYGVEEVQTALRAFGKILTPRIRLNDILARISAEDLALILPHTGSQGAAIKAERIRRLFAAADFSKLLPRFPQLTVSVGVSEYPTCCRDADDLFSTADDALWQVKDKQSNKVCVATPVAGFVPDFLVHTD